VENVSIMLVIYFAWAVISFFSLYQMS